MICLINMPNNSQDKFRLVHFPSSQTISEEPC